MVLVRNWLHNRSDCEAVEIVIDEDEHTEKTGGKFCGPFAADFCVAQAPYAWEPPALVTTQTRAPRRAKKRMMLNLSGVPTVFAMTSKGKATISMKPAPVKAQ